MSDELPDGTMAWSFAVNCLMYEEDDGLEELNMGTVHEPKMVSRSEAWRELYSRLVLEKLEADVYRLNEAIVDLKAKSPLSLDDGAREVDRVAVNLCERGIAMIHAAGAHESDDARQRFIAGLRHANTSDVLGSIPGVKQNSAASLLQTLAHLDSRES